jgi:RecG-like helicase
MEGDDQFKRNVAFKFRIGDVVNAKPIHEQERFSFLDIDDKKVVRVNLVGNIVERYDSGGDKKYCFFVLDDGSGQIKLKSFGDDILKFESVSQGQTVIIIGIVRYWNNEVYVSPEIIREEDPKYLLLRKLEIEKDRCKVVDPLGRDKIAAVKDKILSTIKNAEDDGGIEIDKIIVSLREISPVIINQEVQKFLEEGIVFEPRPGKVRYLG